MVFVICFAVVSRQSAASGSLTPKIIVKKEAKSNNLNLNLKTMASIKNFDNFTHTINGLVYNTANRLGKTAPT